VATSLVHKFILIIRIIYEQITKFVHKCFSLAEEESGGSGLRFLHTRKVKSDQMNLQVNWAKKFILCCVYIKMFLI